MKVLFGKGGRRERRTSRCRFNSFACLWAGYQESRLKSSQWLPEIRNVDRHANRGRWEVSKQGPDPSYPTGEC